jgi:hypothetical protein
MKRTIWRSALAAGTLCVLATGVPAHAALIDFENAPSRTFAGDTTRNLQDDDPVTTEYSTPEGVTFSGGFLEQYNEDGTDGFLNDQMNARDRGNDEPNSGLGTWFLRTDGTINVDGSTNRFLRITYNTPVSEASGEIWDIDGNDSQGTERWDVVLFNNGTQVTTIQSPTGTDNGPGSRDGLPWVFNASPGSMFDEIQFQFSGTKESGIGLAFDNFNTNTANVPVPASLALLGAGLVGLGMSRRARR